MEGPEGPEEGKKPNSVFCTDVAEEERPVGGLRGVKKFGFEGNGDNWKPPGRMDCPGEVNWARFPKNKEEIT